MKSINYGLLFFGCVVFHMIGTWALPLIDRDEPRFAEASREMIERGDYVVPHFNNQLRLDKPPLAYWMQVASYRIFGENDFAARFPSAIAAGLVALALCAWGSRIGRGEIGLWAAIVFTLCLQTFVHAKAAVADMWLVLFVTTAHWSGFELLRNCLTADERKRPTPMVWWFVFYMSLAFGFLAKGPIAWTPVLTVAAIKFVCRDIRVASRFKFVRGILLMLAIVALWGVPALIRTNGEFLRIGIGRHVIGRSFGAMEGHGGNSLGGYLLLLPFYFITVFISFFPWSIKLPWLAGKLFGKRSADGGNTARDLLDNYLICGVAIVFIIFTLIKTKLPHYTLPAFPLLALLLVRHWPEQKRALFKRISFATLPAFVAIALIVPPVVAGFFPSYALFRASRDDLRPDMEFSAVSYQEPSLVWYFRSRIKGWMTPMRAADVSQFMAKPGPRFAILPSESATTVFAHPQSDWKTFATHGFNIAKGRSVDLTLVLKQE